MQTMTIKVNNTDAVKLLEDLEALHIIEVISKSVEKEKKLSKKSSAGIISEQGKKTLHKPIQSGKNPEAKLKARNKSLRKLLLDGPVFTEKQIKSIEDTHKSINEWRVK